MKYSIILPVRNGGSYVKECVSSILAQTLNDFNLIVLDNYSTDGTTEWLAGLTDERIVLYKSNKPLTIEENWARIVTVPKNEFISLIGHDDLLDPSYLETMDRLIAKHPDATLYQTHFRFIDSRGDTLRRCKPMDEVQSASEFLAFFLSNTIDVNGTGFMVRSIDYDKEGGIPTTYPNLLFADFQLWINITLKGYKATSVQECFGFRLHQSMTTTSSDTKFNDAYTKFIEYLVYLTVHRSELAAVIRKYALDFIVLYNKGLSHRLLRTLRRERGGRSVASFLRTNKDFADRLVPGNAFDPQKDISVKLAKIIDGNFLLRNLFLLFKKIYKKPLYK